MSFFSFELCVETCDHYLWWSFSKEAIILKNSSSNRVKLFQCRWCWCIIEHYFCRYQYHSSDPLGLPKWIIQACIKGVFKLFCNKSVLFIWYLMQLQQDFPLTKNLWNHSNMHSYPIANLSPVKPRSTLSLCPQKT